MSLQIHQISIEEDSIMVAYTDWPADIRVKGELMMQRQIQISMKHPDYREDGELMLGQAMRLLKNALEDFEDSPPYEPPKADDGDDDDDPGMGWRPGERDASQRRDG